MPEQKNIEKCIECDSELFGQFCSSCGRPQIIKRINGEFLLSEIAVVFNFQKGILYTIKELLLRPGSNIKKFIQEDRNRLVKPISFILLCSLIYIITQKTLHFEDGYINFSNLEWGDSSVLFIMNWISDNYGFANILMAIFMAMWAKVFFEKYNYNFFEILILLYFVIGIQMLMFSFFGLIESLTNLTILDKGSIVAIGYVCWAIGQFFDSSNKLNYLKALFSYMLGMISFTFLAIVCGILIDWIIK